MRGAEHIGRVLVLGLGKSGKSAARYCAALLGTRVDSLFIAAGARTDDSAAFVESLQEQVESKLSTDPACHSERSAHETPTCHPERSAQRGAEGSRALPANSNNVFNYAFGDDALEGGVGHFDLCIASPGIPFWHELYVRGAELSDELVSEIEFAWRESAEDSTWVAITGTNGKTTTTSLAAHVLRECGFAADAVGNIGDVCLDAVAAGKTQVYVAEVSSYQLYSTRLFAPDVAVLLNITPDHIHWHQTLEAYAEAKFKVLNAVEQGASPVEQGASPGVPVEQGASPGVPKARADSKSCCAPSFGTPGPAPCSTGPAPCSTGQAPCSTGSCAILDATNDVVRAKVREMRAAGRDDYIPMGTADGVHGDMRSKCGAANAAFLGGNDELVVAFGGEEHVLGKASDLQITGEHNASNALAAAAVAVALGADDAAIAEALASFKPLAHRIEPCGSVAGVACYNDSKATNVDATLKALAAFPGKRVVVMLGGDDKGTDLSELVAATHEHAAVAVCYGEGGPRFYRALTESPAPQPSADAPGYPVGAGICAPAAESRTPQASQASPAPQPPADAPGCPVGVGFCSPAAESRTPQASQVPPAPQPSADAPGCPVGAGTCSPAAESGTPQASQVPPAPQSPAAFTCFMANHMEDAFDAALSAARPGDVVLLSPACASFDEFRSFEHRGDVFKQLVAARAETRGA